MKKLLLFVIVLFIAKANIKAQIGQPYAPVGAKWTYLDFYFSSFPFATQTSETFQVEAVADTVINNRRCSKLEITANNVNNVLGKLYNVQAVNYYHVDNRQVFRYDTALDSFFLLYDFSISLGDTFKVVLNSSIGQSLEKFRAIIIDTLPTLINGTSISKIRYQLQLDSNISNPFPIPSPIFEVIEGIGQLNGPGYDIIKVFNAQGGIIEIGPITLRCYEDSIIGLYKFPGVVNCDTSFNTLVRSNYGGKPMELYPNPAQNQMRINLGQEINKPQMLYLRDISGKLVKTYSITEPNQTLDIVGVAKGLYFVSVVGYRVQKLVVN